MLSIGLVGLPNVGKSSLFNALVAGGANVSNYPFTTIESNIGVASVPDERLERLRELLDPAETTAATIRFIDIAGLVEGAAQGEGLGNQFLSEIRQVDAIVHVLRCFEHSEIAHVAGSVDPVRDAAVVETELLLADLEVLGGAIERRRRAWKADPGAYAEEERRLERYRSSLEEGRPLRVLGVGPAGLAELKGLGLLTGKPVVWVANVGEGADAEEKAEVERSLAETLHSNAAGSEDVVAISAGIEAELALLDATERLEFMKALALERTGLERLVAACFEKLALIRFYTEVNRKLRAWDLRDGSSALEAAGRIHTDMASGFVKARVIDSDDLLQLGSLQAVHDAGRVRTEGRDYVVRNGDLIEFAFRS